MESITIKEYVYALGDVVEKLYDSSQEFQMCIYLDKKELTWNI